MSNMQHPPSSSRFPLQAPARSGLTDLKFDHRTKNGLFSAM
jgi:hypothetical protein